MRWVIPRRGDVDVDTTWADLTAYILRDHGPGSLYMALRNRQWVEEIWSTRETGDVQDGYAYLSITIQVTRLGWGK